MLWRWLFRCRWGRLTDGDDPLVSDGWVVDHTNGGPS